MRNPFLNELEPIRERENKASPGPWRVAVNERGWHPEAFLSGPLCLANGGYCLEDGQFIAHSREDIPRLLFIISEMEKEIEKLKNKLEQSIPDAGLKALRGAIGTSKKFTLRVFPHNTLKSRGV